MKGTKLAGTIAICSFLALLLNSCSTTSYQPIDRPRANIDPNQGIRHQFRYVYYPDSFVYFDSSRRAYFFIDKGEWRGSLDLPKHITVDPANGVYIDMATNQPYQYFEEHLEKYPPRDSKKYGRKRKKTVWRR